MPFSDHWYVVSEELVSVRLLYESEGMRGYCYDDGVIKAVVWANNAPLKKELAIRPQG